MVLTSDLLQDDARGAQAQALRSWSAATAAGCPEAHPLMLELAGIARSAARISADQPVQVSVSVAC